MTYPMLHSRQLEWPTDWDALFGRSAPLLVEIGFGNGQFLIELTKRRPSANIIGLEISLPSLRKAEKKMKTEGLTNGRVIQSDAQLFLWTACAPQTISEVYINFPDPWPKERQYHRRLINERFLHLLATRMIPDGLLDIATDHPDYQPAVVEALCATPYFDSRLDTVFISEDNERIRTKYEQKALDEGRICHYYKWQRNRTPAPNPFPVPLEIPMPHAVLQSALNLHQISERFAPFQMTINDTNINYMAVYQQLKNDMILIEVYIVEEPLKQRVGLGIRHRDDGTIVIGLHEIGFPRPTVGVQLAVKQLADWLLSLHPDTILLHHNLVKKV